MDLEVIRQEIDRIDRDLVALLEERMKLVGQVVAFKKANGKAVLDSKREEIIFKKVADCVEDKQYEETILATFAAVLKQSRTFQEKQLRE